MPPYRELAERPKSAALAPTEFVYLAAATERRSAALRRVAGWLWLAAILCLVSVYAVPSIGGWLSLGLVAFVLWKWRESRKPERIVVSVKDGWVDVSSPTQSARFRLQELCSVELQTRSIEKAYADKMVGTVVVSTGVRPSIDVSRIVLVLDTDDPLVLGTDYEPNSGVTEWLGKMRVFLRKHGWVPLDERDEDPDSVSS